MSAGSRAPSAITNNTWTPHGGEHRETAVSWTLSHTQHTHTHTHHRSIGVDNAGTHVRSIVTVCFVHEEQANGLDDGKDGV